MKFELHSFEMQLGFLQSKTVVPHFAGSRNKGKNGHKKQMWVSSNKYILISNIVISNKYKRAVININPA